MILARGQPENTLVMEIVTDPEELARAKEQDARFKRNLDWFTAHASEIFKSHRGEVICVAGQELFAGDDILEVLARAKAAHPEEKGQFIQRIPKERMDRIYALSW